MFQVGQRVVWKRKIFRVSGFAAEGKNTFLLWLQKLNPAGNVVLNEDGKPIEFTIGKKEIKGVK